MASNGSVIIYHRLIKPFVKKHEKDFDEAFSEVSDIAKDVGKHGMFVIHVVVSNCKVCTRNFCFSIKISTGKMRIEKGQWWVIQGMQGYNLSLFLHCKEYQHDGNAMQTLASYCEPGLSYETVIVPGKQVLVYSNNLLSFLLYYGFNT